MSKRDIKKDKSLHVDTIGTFDIENISDRIHLRAEIEKIHKVFIELNCNAASLC